jgi:hypothetical protein
VIKVAAIAITLKLRHLCTACCLGGLITAGGFVVLENTFVAHFVLVAFFNFAKKSVFINCGLFNNGIYVP